nr:hypothetical protein [Saprospiraceae bacterium]
MVFPATEKVTEQVTEQVKKLVLVMGKEAHSGNELMNMLSLKHRPTFLYKCLQPATDAGLIYLTIPDKPRSSKQKYRLSSKGYSVKQKLESEGS